MSGQEKQRKGLGESKISKPELNRNITLPKQQDSQHDNSTTDPSNNRPKIDKSGLYDLQQVKRLLDDEVISFMEAQGYEESTEVSNIKLVAGSVAVIAAVYSHFGVREFPASRVEVLACVIIYIVCSMLITVSSFLFEASAMFVGHLTPLARRVKTTLPQNVWVHTVIGGKGSSKFRVQVRTAVREKQNISEDSHGYEKYFTSEGHFLKDRFTNDMKETLDRLVQSTKKKQ